MAKKTTLFDVTLRAVECPNCSAPIQCARHGGTVKCAFCGISSLVERRLGAEVRPRTKADEIARLSRLKAQVDHPIEGHAYDLEHTPPGLEPLARALGTPAALAGLQAEWKRLKKDAADSSEGQHRLSWVANRLADQYFSAGDQLRGRAVLETAVDELGDENHRHIARCRLAFQAACHQDAESAVGWLAECDPAPELLEIDGERRIASARLALLEDRPRDALSEVGQRLGDIPTDPPHQTTFSALCVAALEAMGHDTEALARLREADPFNTRRVSNELARLGLAPRARHARDVELQRQSKALRRGCMVVLTLAGLAAVAIVVGRFFYLAYRPFPIVCDRGEHIEIDDRSVSLANEVLITGSDGCHVSIRGSKLKGKTVVSGGYNMTIEVVGSELRGSDGVLDVGWNATLDISKSKLKASGEKAALTVGYDSTVSLKNTEMQAEGQAMEVQWGGKVSTQKSTVVSNGGEWAIELGYNSSLAMVDTTIEAHAGALLLAYSTELTIDQGKVTAGAGQEWLALAGYQSRLRIKGATLESRAGGISMGWSSELDLQTGTKLTTAAGSVAGEYQSRVTLDGATVASGPACAIQVPWSARVVIKNKSSLTSKGNGVCTTYKSRVEITGSKVVAGGVAVKTDWESHISIVGGPVEGKAGAIEAGRATTLDVGRAQIVGEQRTIK